MSAEKRSNIIATVSVILLLGALTFLSITTISNSRLAENLKKEKLAAEAALSQHLASEKEIYKLNESLSDIHEQKNKLEKLLNNINAKLQEKEEALVKTKKMLTTSAQNKDQLQELMRQKKLLEQQITYYKQSFREAQEDNEEKDQLLTTLQADNKILTDNLSALKLKSMTSALITSSNKNNKLTIRSKRTKKLSFNVGLASNAKNLQFNINDPGGNNLPIDENNFSFRSTKQDDEKSKAFYATTTNSMNPAFNDYQTVEVNYTPKEKLKPGIYTIGIMTDGLSIGSLQVKLR
jgi:hypothetical protein